MLQLVSPRSLLYCSSGSSARIEAVPARTSTKLLKASYSGEGRRLARAGEDSASNVSFAFSCNCGEGLRLAQTGPILDRVSTKDLKLESFSNSGDGRLRAQHGALARLSSPKDLKLASFSNWGEGRLLAQDGRESCLPLFLVENMGLSSTFLSSSCKISRRENSR